MIISKRPRQFGIVPLLVAGLAICASVHAQSTGLFVNSGNNVGIGTASPQGKLHVAGGPSLASGTDVLYFEDPTGAAGHNKYAFLLRNYQSDDFGIYDAANNAYRFYIGGTGNVGIGTTSPVVTLHVKTNTGVRIEEGGGPRQLVFEPPDMNNSSNNAKIYTYGTALGMDFGVGGVPKMTINTSGNVGIGTTNPTRGVLHVAGGRINLEGNSGDSAAVMTMGNATYPTAEIVTPYGGGTLTLAGSSGRGLLIDTSGNIGIGTANPGYLLDVAGTIHASEIITNNYDWADYVFSPAYKLASLSEVEGVIKREGHLPGMPSAADVAAHGLSVGEMQAKLLQKIEELTLHQIDEEKRIEQLEKENAGLRERAAK
jgi:hypothetical protein